MGAGITWLEIYHDETHYTYSPRFKHAARATRGADVHAGRFPMACEVNGPPWGTPGARVARFGVCVPHGLGHRLQ